MKKITPQPKKREMQYDRKFCIMFVDAFDELVSELPKHALRVYLKLVRNAVHNNYAQMSTKELALATGYSEKRVLNAVRILREILLISKAAQGIHLLSQDCVWFGKLAQYLDLDKNESNRDEWFEESSVTNGKTTISHKRYNYEVNPKLLKKIVGEKKRKYAKKQRVEYE
jgi:hypothetical protein